jgi:5,10-methylenetetrahydromethanopterin reductase
MQQTSALGSVQHCVAKLQQFRDAGADEIATYGSTPGQNAELIGAWRNRTVAD